MNAAPALGAVTVSPAGRGWEVTCSRPGRPERCRAFADRSAAVLYGAQMAAMADLAFVQVGAEPDAALVG